MTSRRHNKEGQSALHVGEQIADFVDVFPAKFDLVDLENLVALVKEPGGLGRAAANDPPDDDGLALVPDGRPQRLVRLLDTNNLEASKGRGQEYASTSWLCAVV